MKVRKMCYNVKNSIDEMEKKDMTTVAIINVFFCPILALWIHYRRTNKIIKLDGEFLCWYAIFTVFNMPITKAMVVAINHVFKILILIDSTYYTVLALCSAFLMPYLYEILKKNLSIKCTIEKIEGTINEEK